MSETTNNELEAYEETAPAEEYAEAAGPRLVVTATGDEFSLGDEPVTLGTDPDNAIVLDDPDVSEHHATVRWETDGYVIEDAGTEGGTFVNEQRVEGSMPLTDGDAIRVGNTVLDYRTEPEGEAEPMPAAVPPPPPPTGQPRPAARTSPWLIGGIVVVAAMLLLACIAIFSAFVFDGGDDISDVTSEPPAAVTRVPSTSIPVQPTDTTVPGEPSATPAPTETPTTAPTDVIPPPQVEYFQASPGSITAGSCTTLQWGTVQAAEMVTIEPGIGGVGTPDSIEVCPRETTEYILTAEGPGGTTSASTTVTVAPGLADLVVDSIAFDPNPANAEQVTEVEITISNIGATAAGGFDWQWQAGQDASFDGRIRRLNPGDTTVVVIQWVPSAGYESLSTEAVVDLAGEVPEDDKTNNRLSATLQVIPAPSQPETTVIRSTATLDGFRLNDGRGSTRENILVGNGEITDPGGELIARGFMSFDLSEIPPGATIDVVDLEFYQAEISGDPYGKLGTLVLEHVDYGASLDEGAYDTPAMDSATLGAQVEAGQWYTVSSDVVAGWLQDDITSGSRRFQIRLRFSTETDGDGEEDWISVEPGGSILGSSRAPRLTATYVP
jgi:pSer/pThr/pTyr-binding forkhead associated (FHA) protein